MKYPESIKALEMEENLVPSKRLKVAQFYSLVTIDIFHCSVIQSVCLVFATVLCGLFVCLSFIVI